MGNCHSKRKEPSPRRTKQSISPLPTGLSAAENPSMFNNAQSPHITGGLFNIGTTNINTGDGPSLDVLFKRVAPNAILNAGGRADDVRCLPGTREEVIDRIERWGDSQDTQTAPMFWLSGPAGAGKSAIIQTVAERCKERGVPHANFFFFRADTSRSDGSPLIPTLLHQLILLYPSLRNSITALLSANPLIFNSTLEDQLEQLLVVPLHSIQHLSSPNRPLLLLIDGLDECDSENKRHPQLILRAFDKVLEQYSQATPFRVLVASRDESQIRAAFNRMSSHCLHLYLDDQYSPEHDIRVFVNAKFEEVRKIHPLAYTLGPIWPLVEDIDYIVEKSSGQFIYAATVMRFILDSSASPQISLERVRGAARLATKSPFSHLDAIYTYILTKADDQDAVKDVLCAQLLIRKLNALVNGVIRAVEIPLRDLRLIDFLKLYNPRYTEEIILSCLADLTPIAWYQPHKHQLLYHHASFPEFLLDKARSGDYFVDVSAFNHKICLLIWGVIHDKDRFESFWEQVGVPSLFALETFPPSLLDRVASPSDAWRYISVQPRPPLFNLIHEQCTADTDIDNLKRMIRQWIYSFESTTIALNDFTGIPFTSRYFYMTRADNLDTPNDEMMAALCPASDFDRQESSMWLNDLLQRIRKEVYPGDSKRANQLLGAWISWAHENNIPYQALDNLTSVDEHSQSEKKN